MKILRLLGLVLLVLVAYLLFAPIAQTPRSWSPPQAAALPRITGSWDGLAQLV